MQENQVISSTLRAYSRKCLKTMNKVDVGVITVMLPGAIWTDPATARSSPVDRAMSIQGASTRSNRRGSASVPAAAVQPSTEGSTEGGRISRQGRCMSARERPMHVAEHAPRPLHRLVMSPVGAHAMPAMGVIWGLAHSAPPGVLNGSTPRDVYESTEVCQRARFAEVRTGENTGRPAPCSPDPAVQRANPSVVIGRCSTAARAQLRLAGALLVPDEPSMGEGPVHGCRTHQSFDGDLLGRQVEGSYIRGGRA
jgi:hypothetical protein